MATEKTPKKKIPVSAQTHAQRAAREEILPASAATNDEAGLDDVDAGNATTPTGVARVYKGTQHVDHDLFKLEVAFMKKNLSWTDIPDIERVEHVHFFHTHDSNGRKQTTSSSVGGHHHDIKETRDAAGVPSLEVGPPMKWVKKKIRGRLQKVAVPISFGTEEGDEGDHHTHKTTYRGSDRIQVRETNVEFAKFETAMKLKQESGVEGVIGG